MLRTGIPASYWRSAPPAEVHTVLDLLSESSSDAPQPAAGNVRAAGGSRGA